MAGFKQRGSRDSDDDAVCLADLVLSKCQGHRSMAGDILLKLLPLASQCTQ